MKQLTIALCTLALSWTLQVPGAKAAAQERVLYSFCDQQGCIGGVYPWAGVTLVGDELFTSTTLGGNDSNSGSMVAVNISTGKARVAYPYAGHSSELTNVNGVMYGASESSPSTLFSFRSGINLTSGLRTLYRFCSQPNCTDGAFVQSDLLYTNGLLYGMTSVGGENIGCHGPEPGCGTIYSFNLTTGEENVLHSFCTLQSCADGSRPAGALIIVDGVMYGTTVTGGDGDGCDDTGGGCGTVFSFDPVTGTETALHVFSGIRDGGAPKGLLYLNGLLYGITQIGGVTPPCSTGDGCGTAFSIDPVTGSKTTLHSFQGGPNDGEAPTGALIDVNGLLYGTTRLGGAHGAGTVFSINPANGKEKIVYSFCSQTNCTDGAAPYAGLIQVNGTLYGTTDGGGAGGGGTIFALTP